MVNKINFTSLPLYLFMLFSFSSYSADNATNEQLDQLNIVWNSGSEIQYPKDGRFYAITKIRKIKVSKNDACCFFFIKKKWADDFIELLSTFEISNHKSEKCMLGDAKYKIIITKEDAAKMLPQMGAKRNKSSSFLAIAHSR